MQNKGFSNFLLVYYKQYLYLIDFNMSYMQLSLPIMILDEIIASSTNGLFDTFTHLSTESAGKMWVKFLNMMHRSRFPATQTVIMA